MNKYISCHYIHVCFIRITCPCIEYPLYPNFYIFFRYIYIPINFPLSHSPTNCVYFLYFFKNTYEPRREKTDLRGFRPGLTQTDLYQLQKQVRSLKFRTLENKGLYYPCSENKGADQFAVISPTPRETVVARLVAMTTTECSIRLA